MKKEKVEVNEKEIMRAYKFRLYPNKSKKEIYLVIWMLQICI